MKIKKNIKKEFQKRIQNRWIPVAKKIRRRFFCGKGKSKCAGFPPRKPAPYGAHSNDDDQLVLAAAAGVSILWKLEISLFFLKFCNKCIHFRHKCPDYSFYTWKLHFWRRFVLNFNGFLRDEILFTIYNLFEYILSFTFLVDCNHADLHQRFGRRCPQFQCQF